MTSEQSKIEIPDPKIYAENLRSARARDSIQLCPSCQRPNKMRSTPITLGTPNQAIVGFQLVTAQQCVFCGKQMIAMFQSCRPNYRELFKFACKQALESDDMTIPWEGDDETLGKERKQD